jgi:nicotinamide riboside transporter PnuC
VYLTSIDCAIEYFVVFTFYESGFIELVATVCGLLMIIFFREVQRAIFYHVRNQRLIRNVLVS